MNHYCQLVMIRVVSPFLIKLLKNGEVILTGNINLRDGHDINSIDYIITRDKSKTELAQYLHACEFSPVISTFQDCIKRGIFCHLARR